MRSINIPTFIVDAFAEKQFQGNPAAVCPLTSWLDKETMQSIAMENNLSETAFFVFGNDGIDLKWFSPETEIDLCGHATLASAHIIYNHFNKFSGEKLKFLTNSGPLYTTQKGDLITLDFPSFSFRKINDNPLLEEALGNRPKEVFESEGVIMGVFESEMEIREMKPHFALLKDLPYKIIYITAPGNNVDFVSRVFGPAVGINEDPVTGSAHCYLTPYWAAKLGKRSLTALQVSKRSGKLYCEISTDRVFISGKARTYLKGEINIDI